MAGQQWRSGDYQVTTDGYLMHTRWLNPDGTRKEGLELRLEQMRVELQNIARRLMDLTRELDNGTG